MMIHTPHTVITGEFGVVFVSRKKETTHPWTDFAHAVVTVSFLHNQQCLILFDATGRRATKLSGDLEDFDVLAKLVQRKILEARAQTVERVALQRFWFLAGVFIVTGCLLGPTACYFSWLAIRGIGEFVTQSEGMGAIVSHILFLGLLLFGIVMAILFVAGGVLHLARLDIKRSPSGFGWAFEREPEY